MSNSAWDFEIKKILLGLPNIDAGRPLGVVIAQPHFDLNLNSNPHFQIKQEFRQPQCNAIVSSFAIRAEEMGRRCVPFPFIIFPEASIPTNAPNGLEIIADQMQKSEGEVIFIGGLEGTSLHDFGTLMHRYQPADDNGIAVYRDGRFVNACVIVVKDANGAINWYFQAKLAQSQWEQSRSMAEGQRILYFQAPNLTFTCQICFDHIAKSGQESLNDTLFHNLIDFGSLNFHFVLECNPKPEDDSFQKKTESFLNSQDPRFNTALTTLIAVNRADVSQTKPSMYGCCGIYYRGGRWGIPSGDLGPIGYQFAQSNNVTSAIFRKRTEAIHVAELVPTSHNTGDPGNFRQPLKLVRSYLINTGCDEFSCSCLRKAATSSNQFVECTSLPCKLRDILNKELPKNDGRFKSSDADLTLRLLSNYELLREKLFSLKCDRAVSLLAILFFQKHQNPDLWGTDQTEAIIEAVSALAILREAGDLEFNTYPVWTAELNKTVALAAVDGCNEKHPNELTSEYLQLHSGVEYIPKYRQKKLLIVATRSVGRLDEAVISYHADTTKATRATRNRVFGQAESPYEPDALQIFLCRDDFFQEVRHRNQAENYFRTEMRKVLGSEQTIN